jgi:hypothetical protein
MKTVLLFALLAGMPVGALAGEDLGQFCFLLASADGKPYGDQLFLGVTVANEFINVSLRWDGLDQYRLYGSGAGGESGPLVGMWQLALALRNDSNFYANGHPVCSTSIRLNKTTLNGNLALSCTGGTLAPFANEGQLLWDRDCDGAIQTPTAQGRAQSAQRQRMFLE